MSELITLAGFDHNGSAERVQAVDLVGRAGFEPATIGLKVQPEIEDKALIVRESGALSRDQIRRLARTCGPMNARRDSVIDHRPGSSEDRGS